MATSLVDDACAAKITAWVEQNLAGTIRSVERQARWRPAWFVEAETPEGPLSLYVRGRREQSELLFYPLAHEAEVLRVLGAADIPVPKIYGLCEDPEAIVMQRLPGRPNLATADTPEQAAGILLTFMDILARMHAIPPQRFRGAGLETPSDPAELAFNLFDRFEAIQKANKTRPEPEVMFAMRWLRRNLPAGRYRPAFISCDAGQFLFDQGKLTGLLDLELAHIGDPAIDLGALLLRDLSEPLGDLTPAFARYAERTGEPIDWPVIYYFVALFAIMTPMVTAHLAKDPPPELAFIYNLDQTLLLTRIGLEAMAHAIGLDLPPPPPQLEASGKGGTIARNAAMRGLLGALQDVQPAPGYMRYRRDGAAEVAAYLGILDEHEDRVIAEERAEAAALLGRDIEGEAARDLALEAFAQAAGPELDNALIRFFYHRSARRYSLLGPKLQLFVRREMQRPDLAKTGAAR
jgi:aminoglycoside phosphotransferase (APT) family kinase protein